MTHLAITAAFVLALIQLSAAQEKKTDEKKDELKLSKEEQAVIDLTNAERKKEMLPPLVANPKLMAAARAHAENMAKQDMLKHKLDDKEPWDRTKDAGYKNGHIGENIHWNAETPKEAMKDWMGSQLHRENILKKEFEEIGVGVVKNKKGERYWAQVFGSEAGK